MQQSYELIDIDKIIREGIYIKDIQFNSNKKNIQRIIDYLQKLIPNTDSFPIVVSIIKFYRFPCLLCFAPLYQRIQQLSAQQQQDIKADLLQIAALVSSFLKYLNLQHFKEINFYFKWGISKKRYKFQMAKNQIEFAQFIIKLSSLKAEIQRLAETTETKQMKTQKINEFLSLQMQRQLNPFENNFLNFIRKQTVPAILKIQDQQDEYPQNKKQKQTLQNTQQLHTQDKHYKQYIKNTPVTNLKDFPSLLQKQHKNRVNQSQPKPNFSPSFDRQNHQQNSVSSSNTLPNMPTNRKPFQFYVDQCSILPKQKQKQTTPLTPLTPICCRTCFYESQTIQQPENLRIQYKLYHFPFHDRKDEQPSKKQKIKRTLCGFLNAEGGTIYFGIKETEKKQRLVNGMFLTENQKIQFRKTIFKLLEDIRPDVGKRCEIKWVPLRYRKNDSYIAGTYVVKVIIQQGDKDQVYSYEQLSKNGRYQQKFAFKTENQALIKNNAQEILKIFKNKIEQPPRVYYPIHSHPCMEPEIGKQVIGDSYLEQEEDREYTNYNSYSAREKQNRDKAQSSEPVKDQLGDKLMEQTAIIRERKKYMQKDTNEFIIKSNSQQDLQIQLRKIGYIVTDIKQLTQDPIKIFYVKLAKTDKKLESANLKLMKIYARLSYRKLTAEQSQILQMVIAQYKQLSNQDMRNREDKILLFVNALEAAKFYVRLHDMNINLEFTALA